MQRANAPDIAEPGSYRWRLASIRPDGDHGPFGDTHRFNRRTVPEPAAVDWTSDGDLLVFG